MMAGSIFSPGPATTQSLSDILVLITSTYIYLMLEQNTSLFTNYKRAACRNRRYDEVSD